MLQLSKSQPPPHCGISYPNVLRGEVIDVPSRRVELRREREDVRNANS